MRGFGRDGRSGADRESLSASGAGDGSGQHKPVRNKSGSIRDEGSTAQPRPIRKCYRSVTADSICRQALLSRPSIPIRSSMTLPMAQFASMPTAMARRQSPPRRLNRVRRNDALRHIRKFRKLRHRRVLERTSKSLAVDGDDAVLQPLAPARRQLQQSALKAVRIKSAEQVVKGSRGSGRRAPAS